MNCFHKCKDPLAVFVKGKSYEEELGHVEMTEIGHVGQRLFKLRVFGTKEVCCGQDLLYGEMKELSQKVFRSMWIGNWLAHEKTRFLHSSF